MTLTSLTSLMPGLPRPRGPFCPPRIVFTPAHWLRSVTRCALFAAVLVGLFVEIPVTCGQRIQLRREAQQDESLQGEGVYRFDSAFNSRWFNGRGRLKNQSRSLFPRRSLLSSQRVEQRRGVSQPRLAEAIKSRDYPELLEQDWQSMTVDHDTPGTFRVFEQLPDRHFSDVPHGTFDNLESLPVAVRQSQADQRLFFYLANASPWRLRIHLQLTKSVSKQTAEKIESLLHTKTEFVNSPDDARRLTVELAPYDLVGGSAEMLGPIESYTFEYLDDVASDLRKRVFALQVKLQQAQQAKSLNMLSNPEFLASESTSGPIDGWEIGQQSTLRFKLLNDSEDKIRDPKSAEKVTSSQPVVKQNDQVNGNVNPVESYLQVHSVAEETTWVRSQPIYPTETGRLSISVWLRVPADTKKVPEIRMAIDGRTPDKEYYRFGVVGREPVGRDQADSLGSVEGRWKRFAVHFDDLPSSLNDLRIGFDVVGEGVVDIGRVELFDRWYDNSEAKAITQLLASADAMLRQPVQFDRCRRLLAEHWAVFLDDHFSLKPIPKNTPQSVPMFKPKVADASADKPQKNNGTSKAGKSLNR